MDWLQFQFRFVPRLHWPKTAGYVVEVPISLSSPPLPSKMQRLGLALFLRCPLAPENHLAGRISELRFFHAPLYFHFHWRAFCRQIAFQPIAYIIVSIIANGCFCGINL